MEKSIKVSIITVSYNSEKTICRCMDSILNQTYQNIEYIIIDGNSTDGTVERIKEYEKLFDGRMKWISEPDDGIYFAMNKGIKMATGELIGLLNSDDAYELDAVESIVERADCHKYQILYGFERDYENGEVQQITMVYHNVLPEKMINHVTCFVTSNIYRDFGMFDTQYVSVSDYDFMIKMKNNPNVEFIPVYKLITNFYAGGMSQTHEAYIDLLKMEKNYGKVSFWKYNSQRIRFLLVQLKKKVKRKSKKQMK